MRLHEILVALVDRLKVERTVIVGLLEGENENDDLSFGQIGEDSGKFSVGLDAFECADTRVILVMQVVLGVCTYLNGESWIAFSFNYQLAQLLVEIAERDFQL